MTKNQKRNKGMNKTYVDQILQITDHLLPTSLLKLCIENCFEALTILIALSNQYVEWIFQSFELKILVVLHTAKMHHSKANFWYSVNLLFVLKYLLEGCETIKTLKSGITDEGCSSFCNALQNTNFSMSLLRSLQRDSIFTWMHFICFHHKRVW